jgi:hypothetical protein
MFERFIISTGVALLLMAAPVGAAPRMVPNQPAQISAGRLNVACEAGDPACQDNPASPQRHAPDQPKIRASDQPKFHAPDQPKIRAPDHPKFHASDHPKFRQEKNLPELYVPGVQKKHSQTQLRKRPPRDDRCSGAIDKCHKKKHRHRRFHDFPYDYNYYVYPPYDYPHYLVSCSRARIVLQRNGFRSISLIACGGKYHTFQARKGNGKFVVRVRARSGAIAILRRIR